ncbi:GNAT family N-acetyltransferase [Chryseobacterium sp.]|uniref:GNAT family N-acetyltransferase n=1 Tax=Chryseobacterium sp. TaxID=1871047 RepID=UPI001B08269E|nr:GNAT family N-acetyltransferase [Chryseobacterium sp.]MBO9690526.1 GNAT family N-acetyltransferase [Chryseobacterium sp.]
MEDKQLQLEKGDFKIRQLKENEAQLYKAMRLEAIKTEPAMFRVSNPPEAELTDIEWEQRIKNPRLVYGLFKNNQPIGMTSMLLLNPEEAYLGQSYIKKEFRGQGLSSLLYQIRMQSAYQLGLRRLSVSHRKSNLASKAANQRMGFIFTHEENMSWLDGTTEDVLYYLLDL